MVKGENLIGKIAFFDIDGTLYGFDGKEHRIPESTKEALKEFRKNGHLAFVCSGRPLRFIYQIFGENMFDGYICTNGTYIVYNGRCIYNKVIDIDTIKKLIKVFNDLRVRSSFVGQYNGYPYKMKEKEMEQYNLQFKGERFLVDRWKITELEANTLDIFYDNESHLNMCKDYFKDKLIFNTHGTHMSADVSFKDLDKSDAIKYIINYIKISTKDAFAFGDGYNDITMFKTVGTGIAMGNAIDELKNIASYVTDKIFEDGLYKAMIKYKLIGNK